MKKVIEAQELRAERYKKVEELQSDLDMLLKSTERDKKKHLENEQTLSRRIHTLDDEIQRYQSKNKDDHEFFLMENQRKDQAIEAMQ